MFILQCAVMLFHVLVYCLLPQSTNSLLDEHPYYISPNRFDFNNAQLFCRVRCNSELSSIHNEDEYQQSLSIIRNSICVFHQNKDVWSGLNDIQTEGVYEYVDKTLFLFNGTFPWKPGSPNNANPLNGNGGQDCIEYSHSFHYSLDDTECNNLDRVLCNNCDSVLNKFVIINEEMYYDEAELFCNEQIATNLASIHSFDDHNEAVFLCQRYDYDCWVGLLLNDGLFEWTDDTQFDYGNDLGLGVYPWDTQQPNATFIQRSRTDTYGIALVGNSWSVFPGDANKHYFLCSLPSPLCDENAWNIIHNVDEGDAPHWIWKDSCELDIHSSTNTNDIAINYQQWINSNGELIIEYMFKMTDMYTDEKDDNTYSSGVLLFNFESICNYYEIGIVYVKKNKYNAYVGKWMNGVYRLLQTKSINDEFGTYYVLRTVVIHKYKLGVFVNGQQYLDVVDKDRIRVNHTIRQPYMSGYIGLINNNLKITAKSLHVSGSAVSQNDTQGIQMIEQCKALIKLQHMVNEGIEYKIEYGVITSIIIHIKTNAFNISNVKFNNILSNITNNVVNESIKDIDADCVFENKIEINQIQNSNRLRINITIFVCKKQTQYTLTAEFSQNLQRDFIRKVNDKSNENEVLLSFNTSDVEVQVANTERMVLVTPSSTLDASDTSNGTLDLMEIWNTHTMWIILGLAAVCSFGIIVIMVCVRCCKSKRKTSSKRDEIGGGEMKTYNDHSIPIMELRTESVSMDMSMEDENTPFKWKKQSDPSEMQLIVRYPGDDDKFHKLCDERYGRQRMHGKAHEMDNYIGPGFSVSDKPHMSDGEFVIESDSDRNVATKQ